ncbi:hypothetical protein [Haliangium ochraceum]|uniref:Uncharacterized protein n=1 Tax=Haliangium ochraceum (strain DSM 14365 / JCM 11303 / SMP-2) TaxID=502025 RepID=D0LGP1_HALO1|nr:hypothetical protein [Haliangium ochraceum]ACY12787.1 conserved hypothetical protein [Haliangium ochraceum DSM 14365]
MKLAALHPGRRASWAGLGLIASALLAAAPALADSPSDYLGAREVAMGDGLRADARGAAAATLNPAGLALNRELVFEGSYGYLADDPDAHVVAASGCDSTVPIPGCFQYRYFRRSPVDGEARFRVHEFSTSLARAFGQVASAGVTIKYIDEAGPEGDDSGIAVDGGILLRAHSVAQLAVVGYNLVTFDETNYARAVGAGLAVRPLPALAVTADGLWQLGQDGSTGRYGGGAEYFISTTNGQSGYPLRAGVVHDVAEDATYVSAGLGIASSSVGIDLGGRKQIGGDGFDIVANLRIFGPRMAQDGNRYYQ